MGEGMSLFEVLIGVLILSISLIAVADIMLIASGSIFHDLSAYLSHHVSQFTA
jgi:Tfp pilus assembly protein PilV